MVPATRTSALNTSLAVTRPKPRPDSPTAFEISVIMLKSELPHEAPNPVSKKTTRVHHAPRRRGGGVAARGARSRRGRCRPSDIWVPTRVPARRLARCRRARRSKQARVSRVSASARGDLVSDLPGVFQCGGEHAAGALAQSIIATAAIERADARLEAHAAAIASGPNGRADYLGAERCAEHSRRHCRRRATTRSTRRASQIMRVSRTAWLGSCEFRGHGLPNNDRASFAQRRYARGVALGVPAREKRRAVLGRHIGGLDDVLDPEWHTVDGRAG